MTALDWSGFSDTTIVVETRAQSGANSLGEPTFDAPMTSYDGPANVYEKRANIVPAPEGIIVLKTLQVIIDLVPGATPPTIVNGDRVTIGAHHYRVESVNVYTSNPPSIELTCSSNKAW